MVRWGVVGGVATGLLLAAASPLLGPLFTTDPEVRALLVPVLLVAALFQPVAGVVFVLDGVLIGAGDGRYLAWAGVLVLAVFAPAGLLVAAAAQEPGARPGLALGDLRRRVHGQPCRGPAGPRPGCGMDDHRCPVSLA